MGIFLCDYTSFTFPRVMSGSLLVLHCEKLVWLQVVNLLKVQNPFELEAQTFFSFRLIPTQFPVICKTYHLTVSTSLWL